MKIMDSNNLNPTVSVVMPAYNAEKYLAEAIDSILAQTYTDFELIIVNDGSTDATKQIILSYSDPRIVYLENEKNSGICVTLNNGLRNARGKYIARMDSDDISLTDRLAIQVKYMEENPGIAASGTDIEIFGEGITPGVFTQLHTPEECFAGLMFNSCFAHPTVIMRKSILDKYNLEYKDEYRGLEDYALWWEIGKHSQLNNIPQPLLRYRQHKGQETKNVTKRVEEAFLKFTKCRFQDLEIKLSEDEIHLWNSYATGDFQKFDKQTIKQFIELSSKVIKHYPGKNYATNQALKLTLSKAITYILHNTENTKIQKQLTYSKALLKGVFPCVWYAKTTYHNLVR